MTGITVSKIAATPLISLAMASIVCSLPRLSAGRRRSAEFVFSSLLMWGRLLTCEPNGIRLRRRSRPSRLDLFSSSSENYAMSSGVRSLDWRPPLLQAEPGAGQHSKPRNKIGFVSQKPSATRRCSENERTNPVYAFLMFLRLTSKATNQPAPVRFFARNLQLRQNAQRKTAKSWTAHRHLGSFRKTASPASRTLRQTLPNFDVS